MIIYIICTWRREVEPRVRHFFEIDVGLAQRLHRLSAVLAEESKDQIHLHVVCGE